MKSKNLPYCICILSAISFLACLITVPGHAESQIKLWKRQTVYVPIYSHIYQQGNTKIPVNLSANLVIRNTDAVKKITIISVKYFDSKGAVLKNHLPNLKQLNPMASTFFLIKTEETLGGWGANFIVEWEAASYVTEPIVEAVFTGARGTHAYSFISRGKAIKGTYE